MAISHEIAPQHSSFPPERLIDPDFIDTEFAIMPAAAQEAKTLRERGYDVALADIIDPQAPTAAEQRELDEDIIRLEADPNGAEKFSSPPGMNVWVRLTAKAIALHPLYNAQTAKTLGDGIDPEAYDVPLFSFNGETGLTAAEAVRAEATNEIRRQKAEDMIRNYKEFLGTEIDDETRRYFRGTLDGRAVRTRADLAIHMIGSHFAEQGSMQDRKLTTASLACGAAEPVYRLVDEMKKQGADIEKVILVDQDPMALAGAHSLAGQYELEDHITLEKRDLLKEKLTDYITEPVDVVDMLGLFEYIPNDERFGPMAAELLKQVKQIVKPGGIIVFGNMLHDRPQQTLFSEVVKWQRLKQRTVEQTLDIIAQAGFDTSKTKVRIPAREGVYAVYGVPVEETTPSGLHSGHPPAIAA